MVEDLDTRHCGGMDDAVGALMEKLHYAKRNEMDCIAIRRELEDRLRTLLGIDDSQHGVKTFYGGMYSLKVTPRIDYKVDAPMLKSIAAAAGLEHYIYSMFRWKAEVNMREWKEAPIEVRMLFSDAVTAKPGRAAFIVERQED
jgi:hypothetical protein